MANYIATDTDLSAVADAIRNKGGASGPLEFPDDFVSGIGNISTVNNQSKSKSYTPSESAQSENVTADSGYTGLSQVSVNVGAIPNDYVGSGVPKQAAQTIHPSTTDQSIPSGKYLTGAQTVKAVTTTNLSAENIVSGVTVKVGDSTDDDCVASVTGTAQGGTIAGLVWQDNEGYIHFDDEGGDMYITTPLNVTTNGTYTAPTGVAYTPVSVQVSQGTDLPVLTIHFDSNYELDSVTCNKTYAECVSLSKQDIVDAIVQLDWNGSLQESTWGATGAYDSYSSLIKFNVADVNYSYCSFVITYNSNNTLSIVAYNTKSADNMTVSGATVTAEAGYYPYVSSKSVASGSATTPATTVTANPSISVNSSGLITAIASATKSVTPTISAGYVSSGTAGTITVSGSNTSQLTTQAAQTIHPSSSDQTITSGKYLTGTQTIKGVTTTNLSAENIKSGVTVEIGDSTDSDCVKSVTGTYTGGGGETSGDKAGYNDVIFYDSDGSILYSYSASEVLQWSSASDLPPLPEHDGLVCRAWSHDLSSIQTQVTNFGTMFVGPYYYTTDGKTRFYVTIGEDTKSLRMTLYTLWNMDATFDWGDGTTPQTVSPSNNLYICDHTYSSVGNYVIKVDAYEIYIAQGNSSGDVGSILFQTLPISTQTRANNKAREILTKIEVGGNSSNNYRGLGGVWTQGLRGCSNLEEFCTCGGETNTNTSGYSFYGCRKLKAFTGYSWTIGTYDFGQCFSLRFASGISFADYAVSGDQNCFRQCYSLYGISSTIQNRGFFLQTYAFYACYQLRTVPLYSGMTKIQNYSFNGCYDLSVLRVPSSVTTVGTYAFQDCTMCEFHFLSTSPPSISSSSFQNCFSASTTSKIYVPYSSDHSVLDAYKAASYWSNYVDYIFEESP